MQLRLLSGAVGAALVLPASAAYAQQLAPPKPSEVQAVIVTAQKRAEDIQDVPISMVVASGKLLEDYNIKDIRDLTLFSPSLNIVQTPGDYQIYMRGIGSGNQNFAFDQDVSTYVDGIYGGRAHQFAAPFFDIDHVEVLRGPQGALLGKNTAAGAISILTAQPTRTFDSQVTLGSETYTEEGRPGFLAQGYVSGPIGGALYGRLAAKFLDQNGYIQNRTEDRLEPKLKQELVRGTLRYEPTSALAITGKIEYAHYTDRGSDAEGMLPGLQTDLADFKYARDPFGIAPQRSTRSVNGLVKIDYQIGDLTLTSTTGASHYKFHDLKGGGANPSEGFLFNEGEKFTQLSEEVRLTSPAHRPLEYIVGAYFDYSRLSTPLEFRYNLFGGFFVGDEFQEFRQRARTQSVFAQATWNISESLSVMGSLRYTHNSKKAEYANFLASGLPFGPPPVFVPPNLLTGSLRESHTDPSATLKYRPLPNILVYLTYGRGSKAGGFASNEIGVNKIDFAYRPETSTNYEAGLKTSFFERRLVLDLAIFDTKFKDLQVSTFLPQVGVAVSNAGRATSKGVEFDGVWVLTDALSANASVTYLDAKYDDFPGAPCLFNNPTCNQALNNIGGTRIPYSAKWAGNVGVSFTQPVMDDWHLNASANLSFRSKATLEASLNPDSIQKGYAKLDARVELASPGDLWRFAVYGRNLTNKRTMNFTYIWPFPAPYRVRFLEETRLIGVSVTRAFH